MRIELSGHWEFRVLSDGMQKRFVYADGFASDWVYVTEGDDE